MLATDLEMAQAAIATLKKVRSDNEAEIGRLRALVQEVIDSASGDIRRVPGPSEILAESGWYTRAKIACQHDGKTQWLMEADF